MAQPVPYVPVTSFIGYQASQPWFPGQNIDIELQALKATTDQVRANLALIQRDDGALTNGSVGWLQLDAATQLAFTTGLATAGASVAMTDGQLFIGQTGGNPVAKTVTGDVSIAKTGVSTIPANAVTYAKLAIAAQGWTNTRLAKTASYTVLNADKGQTFALSAGGQTLTLGAASGFDANFIITAVNESATRAWSIAPNGLTAFFLYPGQSALIFNQNNVWQVIREKRWQLAGNLTVFVDGALGSDTNDGLLAGAGGAFATIQKGVNFCRDAIDACFRMVVVQVADGTYTQGANLYDVVGVDNGAWNPPSITLRGNVTTPANVVINVTAGSANCLTAVNVHTSWYIEGFKFTTSSGGNSHVVSDYGSTIYLGVNNFGACVAHQIQAVNTGSRVEIVASYTISGNAGGYHWSATWGGEIIASTITVTLTGTPSFVAFAGGGNTGQFLVTGASFSGAGTGPRYAFDATTTCSVAPTTFPGNAVGVVTNQVFGTSTNDAATAGNVGELLSSSVLNASAVALTTDIGNNMTSLSLTPGDWDVWCDMVFKGAATTTMTYMQVGIGPTSATLVGVNGDQQTTIPETGRALFANAGAYGVKCGPVRVSISATTTYFAVAVAGFAVSTLAVYGKLQARRRR